jgi:hypothetical protein
MVEQRMPNKPKKLAIEAQRGGAYVERLQVAGPRMGESRLAFLMRLAALRAGRAAVTSAVEGARNVVKGLGALGVTANNIGTWLERLGFHREELDRAAKVDGLPPPMDFTRETER